MSSVTVSNFRLQALKIFSVLEALLLASACDRGLNPLTPGPQLQGTLCRRVSPSYDPIEPTTRFARGAAKIYCAWVVKGSTHPLAVRGIWYAEDVGKAAPAEYRIDEATVDIERDSRGSFSISRPDRDWPAGQYRLEIYLDNKRSQLLRFVVE